MKENFDKCLAFTLGQEGGWANHPKDPGKATMKGVTLATYRQHFGQHMDEDDLRRISDAQLQQIYRSGYWNPIGGDMLFRGVDLATFDEAVHSGTGRAKQHLATARTKASDPAGIVRALCAARMGFVRSLKTWGTFGKGWARRIGEVEAAALRMAVVDPRQANIEIAKSAGAARDKAQKAGKAAGDSVKGGVGGSVIVTGGGAAGADWGLLLFLGAVVVTLAVVAVVAWKAKQAQDERADALNAAIAGGR